MTCNANVFITPCSCGGTTGKEGIFEIELEPKEYQVVSSIIGFENDTTIVLLEKNTLLEIYLYPTNYQLENITVTSQRTKDNINRTVMGVQQLTSERMKFLPTAIGEVDVLSSLTMLALSLIHI